MNNPLNDIVNPSTTETYSTIKTPESPMLYMTSEAYSAPPMRDVKRIRTQPYQPNPDEDKCDNTMLWVIVGVCIFIMSMILIYSIVKSLKNRKPVQFMSKVDRIKTMLYNKFQEAMSKVNKEGERASNDQLSTDYKESESTSNDQLSTDYN